MASTTFSGNSPVIAKSDFVILLVSLSALGGGVYRWQSSTSPVPALTVPASLQSNVRNPINGTSNDTGSVTAAAALEQQTVDPASPRIVNENAAPVTIVVNAETDDSASSVVPAVQASNTNSTGIDGTSNEPQYGIHQVVYGDYLGRIAERYGTTVSELRKVNKLSGSNIKVGQALRYPLPAN